MSTSTKGRSTHNLGTGSVMGVYVELEVHECGTCGVVFGVASGFMNSRRNDHDWWYCPNGHSWCFSGESALEKAQRQVREERDRTARLTANLDQTEASRRAYKGQVTKLRKRAVAGVCPAGCKRHFKDLERHMESKHPDFKREEVRA